MIRSLRKIVKPALAGIFGATVAVSLTFVLFGEKFLRVDRGLNYGKADAVVVLAGPHPEDRRRLEEGLELIRRGKAEILILPLRHPAFRWQWAVDYYRLSAAEDDIPVLIGRSTASEEPWLDDYGGTFTEAKKTVEIMQKNRLQAAIVVSSAYHTRRAAMAFSCFEKTTALRFFYQSVGPVRRGSGPWWLDWNYVIKLLREYRKVAAAYWVYRDDSA